ncbi:MAG TPA: hypothetical protein VFR10_01825, partial [bacterium]|nr:hypothetical protein [bacterium]
DCTDIAPTILHLFGLPAARDLEGRVLSEIFEDAATAPASPPIASYETHDKAPRSGEVLSSSADTEILEKLKTLGYIR